MRGHHGTPCVGRQRCLIDSSWGQEVYLFILLVSSIGSLKKQENSRKTSTSALLTMPKPLTMWITTNCGIFFKRWVYQTTCMRNLYAGQEAKVRTGHRKTDWFQIGKGIRQGCILSPCLCNFYSEYIMQNTKLDEAQAGIKISGRNISNLICR